jgi:hypothetical protein
MSTKLISIVGANNRFANDSYGSQFRGWQTFSVAEKNGEQFAAELDVLAALIRARVIRARVDAEEAE